MSKWFQDKLVSKLMALLGSAVLVIAAFNYRMAWAGVALLGSAIIFRLLWETGSADKAADNNVTRFWNWLRRTRPVSKIMALAAVVLFIVAAYMKYEVTPTSLMWAGAALLGGAIAFRLLWNN